jgi:outer membrane protein OmpA-like peptidoglycan-associated protein
MISFVNAAVDQNPISAGGTQTRNALGRTVEAAYHNPALLGVDRAPKGGLTVPLTTIGVGEWSDKLALSPFNSYFIDNWQDASYLNTHILTKSFRLEGLNPDEVSAKLTEEFKGGIGVYGGVRYSLINMAFKRVAFDVTSHFDQEVRIPEGPLLLLFSGNRGFQRGNKLDFNDFRQDAIWSTDFTVSLGLPVTIPVLHEFFKMRYGAGGIGVKYVMGHSMLRATTEDAYIDYTSGRSLGVNGKVHVQTAGFGFSGPWNLKNPFEGGKIPISGHGVGFDLGGILYDDQKTLTINFQNLGMLFWTKNAREVTYEIKNKNLTAIDIIRGIDDANKEDIDPKLKIFNRNEGEYISDAKDTLKETSLIATTLPMSFNIGYAYSWDFEKSSSRRAHLLHEYLNASANYEQHFTRAPGQSRIPRISIGGEAGTLYGKLPIRIGFVAGGPEKFASALGAGFNFKYFVINASYKAIGHPFFVPRRGVEAAIGLNVNWGMSTDYDKDGILDKVDKCPKIPEDFDKFDDTDGCPDYDNDADGIPDTSDKCPDIPEDLDGFEDTDGCPDYDNDADGIPDTADQCINTPEDKDNFKDEDGCPDLDNDADGIPDTNDKCPDVSEDFDGFEDSDGCPDYDNDKDGILDTADQCLNEPETYNGYKDEDGCPDTLIKPTEKETKVLNTKLRAINFKTASAELMSSSYVALDFVAQFLQQYPHLRYEIQGHTDSQGSDEYNLLLSAARATTVRSYLLSKGVPEYNLIGIGYGETMPIADNIKASGRAINRRVEFKIIDTNDEYLNLKIREDLFRDQIRNAKIKGYR